MKEITKLDDKYLVLKWKDINKLPWAYQQKANEVCLKIRTNRTNERKASHNYVVLNLDDEIDWGYLEEHLVLEDKVFVRDIAVTLVNAILKAKGD